MLVHSDAKSGTDVGEIIGRAPIGVAAERHRHGARRRTASYAPLLADADVVAQILRSGKGVSTPVGWVYPDRSKTADLEAACAAGNATLHGTGIHPGGITERFPLMLSAMSASITSVRAEEFSDIRTYDAPDVVRHVMLFGAEPDVARKSIMADVLGAGFRQSVHMVADELGFDLDPDLHDARDGRPTKPIDSPIGVIEPGSLPRASGGRASSTASRSSPAVNWLMGEEHLEPAWSFGPDRERFGCTSRATRR